MSVSVSVIIPTLNRCDFLSEAIQSVLRQTFTDFELIVVDDGSTDATQQMMEAYRNDPKVKYVREAYRGSGGAARNTGIRLASGRYLALLDSDDLWCPEKLSRQIEAIEAQPSADVVYCACRFQEVDAQRRVVTETIMRRLPPRYGRLYEDMLYSNVITGSASSVLVRAECFSQVGLFKEHLYGSDLDMWRRLSLRHEFLYVDEPLVQVRQHSGNMSNDVERTYRSGRLDLETMKSEVPPQFRSHLPAVEAQHCAYWCARVLAGWHLRLVPEVLGRLVIFSVLHPIAMSGALRAMFERRRLRRAQPKVEPLDARGASGAG